MDGILLVTIHKFDLDEYGFDLVMKVSWVMVGSAANSCYLSQVIIKLLAYQPTNNRNTSCEILLSAAIIRC